MQFFKFNKNIHNAATMLIEPESELDKLIKECAEEVAPFRVGICCLTDPAQLDKGKLIPMTDRLAIGYLNEHNSDSTSDYIRLLCHGIMSTKFATDGTIWISKGKQRKHDCIPASDVEEMMKKHHPDMFYLFVMDDDIERLDIYGLFLFDDKNALKVHRVSYPVEACIRENKQPVFSSADVPFIGPAAFYALKQLNYLT